MADFQDKAVLKVEVEGASQIDDLNKQTAEVGDTAQKSAGGFAEIAKQLAGVAVAAKAFSTVVGLLKQGVSISDSYEKELNKVRNSVDQAGGSFKQARKDIEDLESDGVASFESMADAYAKAVRITGNQALAKNFLQAGKAVGTFQSISGDAEASLTSFIDALELGNERGIKQFSPAVAQMVKQLGGAQKVSQDAALKQQVLNKVIEEGAGLQEKYNETINTGIGLTRQFDSAYGDFLASIGDTTKELLAPVLKELTSFFSSLLESFNGLSSNSRRTIVAITLIGTAVTALIPIVAGLGAALAAATGGLSLLIPLAAAAATAIGVGLAVAFAKTKDEELAEELGKINKELETLEGEGREKALKRQAELLKDIPQYYRDQLTASDAVNMSLQTRVDLLKAAREQQEFLNSMNLDELRARRAETQTTIRTLERQLRGSGLDDATRAAYADALERSRAALRETEEAIARLTGGARQLRTGAEQTGDAAKKTAIGLDDLFKKIRDFSASDFESAINAINDTQKALLDELEAAKETAEFKKRAGDDELKAAQLYQEQKTKIEEAGNRRRLQAQMENVTAQINAYAQLQNSIISLSRANAAGIAGGLGGVATAGSGLLKDKAGMLGEVGQGLGPAGAALGAVGGIFSFIDGLRQAQERKEQERLDRLVAAQEAAHKKELDRIDQVNKLKQLQFQLEQRILQLSKERLDIELRLQGLDRKTSEEALKQQRATERKKYFQDIRELLKQGAISQEEFDVLRTGPSAANVELLTGFRERESARGGQLQVAGQQLEGGDFAGAIATAGGAGVDVSQEEKWLDSNNWPYWLKAGLLLIDKYGYAFKSKSKAKEAFIKGMFAKGFNWQNARNLLGALARSDSDMHSRPPGGGTTALSDRLKAAGQDAKKAYSPSGNDREMVLGLATSGLGGKITGESDRVSAGDTAFSAATESALSVLETSQQIPIARFSDAQASVDRDVASLQIAGDEEGAEAARVSGYTAIAQRIGKRLGIEDIFNIPAGFADDLTESQKELFDMLQGLLLGIKDNTGETARNTSPDLLKDRARSFIDISRRGVVEGNAFAALGLNNLDFANPGAVQNVALGTSGGVNNSPQAQLVGLTQETNKILRDQNAMIAELVQSSMASGGISNAQIYSIIDEYLRRSV